VPRPSAAERFWSKTQEQPGPLPTPCRVWTSQTKAPGKPRKQGGPTLAHGQFWYEGRCELAHRVAVALVTQTPVRELPLIGHACDNPRCVNPEHLTLSTHTQNLKEAYDRGRRGTNEGNDP
jgi:hypothetical protein